MRSDEDMGEMRALTFAIIAFIIVALALSGCVLFRPWAPSGRPGCARGHQWSDSAQKCITKEGKP